MPNCKWCKNPIEDEEPLIQLRILSPKIEDKRERLITISLCEICWQKVARPGVINTLRNFMDIRDAAGNLINDFRGMMGFTEK